MHGQAAFLDFLPEESSRMRGYAMGWNVVHDDFKGLMRPIRTALGLNVEYSPAQCYSWRAFRCHASALSAGRSLRSAGSLTGVPDANPRRLRASAFNFRLTRMR